MARSPQLGKQSTALGNGLGLLPVGRELASDSDPVLTGHWVCTSVGGGQYINGTSPDYLGNVYIHSIPDENDPDGSTTITKISRYGLPLWQAVFSGTVIIKQGSGFRVGRDNRLRMSISTGSFYTYILVLNEDGTTYLSKRWHSVSGTTYRGVAVDGDADGNTYFETEYTTQDWIILSKINSGGTYDWSTRAAQFDTSSGSMAVAPDGNIWMTATDGTWAYNWVLDKDDGATILYERRWTSGFDSALSANDQDFTFDSDGGAVWMHNYSSGKVLVYANADWTTVKDSSSIGTWGYGNMITHDGRAFFILTAGSNDYEINIVEYNHTATSSTNPEYRVRGSYGVTSGGNDFKPMELDDAILLGTQNTVYKMPVPNDAGYYNDAFALLQIADDTTTIGNGGSASTSVTFSDVSSTYLLYAATHSYTLTTEDIDVGIVQI